MRLGAATLEVLGDGEALRRREEVKRIRKLNPAARRCALKAGGGDACDAHRSGERQIGSAVQARGLHELVPFFTGAVMVETIAKLQLMRLPTHHQMQRIHVRTRGKAAEQRVQGIGFGECAVDEELVQVAAEKRRRAAERLIRDVKADAGRAVLFADDGFACFNGEAETGIRRGGFGVGGGPGGHGWFAVLGSRFPVRCSRFSVGLGIGSRFDVRGSRLLIL